ncbi:type II toxin-antitoxin system VapB family antitoxin [Ornithinimicrobium panacihumi]|uniref:type II toxin-antitoxin system VapB family antitoxin n=1 Tax=Ornithinimicrobium panacihumi TaxID=2008449 RepID=UPI003F88BA79
MSLNIKNPRTHELVRQLAQQTGQSQTSAVEDAVRRRLDELARERGGAGSAAKARIDLVTGICAAYAADLRPEDRERILNADEWLYDEHGLPR